MFLGDKTVDPSDFPAWQVFSSIAGSSRASKLVYLDIVKHQPELARLVSLAAEKESPAAQTALAISASEVSLQMRSDRLAQAKQANIGDIGAVLLASYVLARSPVDVNEWLMTSAHIPPVTDHLQRRGYRDVVLSLYSQWIPKTHESIAMEVIYISLRDGHTSGVEVARRQLRDNLDIRVREFAIQCLARFGDESDLARLRPLLDEKTRCREFVSNLMEASLASDIEESNEPPPGVKKANANKKPPKKLGLPAKELRDSSGRPIAQPRLATQRRKAVMQYRMCDLALAATMMIADENMSEVFPRFRPNGNYAFLPENIAFEVTEDSLIQRDQTIEAWKKQLDARTTESN